MPLAARLAALCAAAAAATALFGCGGDGGGGSHDTTLPAQPRTDESQQPPRPARSPAPAVRPPHSPGRPPARVARQRSPKAVGPCATRERVKESPIRSPRWVGGLEVTEYYSTPESWFVGRRVSAPGVPGRHRVDFLYSARGVVMQGDGSGLDGQRIKMTSDGDARWVTAAGKHTRPSACASRWSHGPPAWLEGGWRDAHGRVTFPLERGGWSAGRGKRRLGYRGVTFAPIPNNGLRTWRTIAVDPGLIPRGSWVYVPYYRKVRGVRHGWFRAEDVGGGIIGRHIDVYRPPTHMNGDGGRYLRDQPVYVVPPGG